MSISVLRKAKFFGPLPVCPAWIRAALIYPVLITMASGCTTTITKTKDPAFLAGMDSLQAGLTRMVSSENINLSGKEITTNGKTASELEISISNGKDVPVDEAGMKNLGRSIAVTVRNDLRDKNEYDTYKVLFITREERGGVIKRNWKGFVFTSKEL